MEAQTELGLILEDRTRDMTDSSASASPELIGYVEISHPRADPGPGQMGDGRRAMTLGPSKVS